MRPAVEYRGRIVEDQEDWSCHSFTPVRTAMTRMTVIRWCRVDGYMTDVIVNLVNHGVIRQFVSKDGYFFCQCLSAVLSSVHVATWGQKRLLLLCRWILIELIWHMAHTYEADESSRLSHLIHGKWTDGNLSLFLSVHLLPVRLSSQNLSLCFSHAKQITRNTWTLSLIWIVILSPYVTWRRKNKRVVEYDMVLREVR